MSLVKSTSISLIFTAILRIEDAPAHHDELTRLLGEPDTCFSESPSKRGSLWTRESPLPVTSDINEHFSWLATIVESHEEYFAKLVSSGIRITLHLSCDTNLDYALLGFDTPLFAPFVRTGIDIEFYTSCNSNDTVA